MEEEEGAEVEHAAEALRLKSLAEHHYLRSDLKSALSHAKRALRLSHSLPGLVQMVAALRVLRAPPLDPFRVLSLPPSSSPSSIRHRHRALSLLLRSPPPLQCSADALPRVHAAFRLLTTSKRPPPREPTLAEMQLEALRLKAQRQRRGGLSKPKQEPPPDAAEDSSSYDIRDFGADRMERTFRKGQVWAVYGYGDGMPRRYALLDEVISVKPFRLRIVSLEEEEEEGLLRPSSCGIFKVGRREEAEEEVQSVGVFSHLVSCERAAREVYRIYPRKGSVWAVYREGPPPGAARKKRHFYYDIVVVLMSYSEAHGMTMAYLEKVEGFKAVFWRKEVGAHAVRWLGKDDLRLFSHQIPARKLSGEEGSGVPRDSWELDPASLPANVLRRKKRGG